MSLLSIILQAGAAAAPAAGASGAAGAGAAPNANMINIIMIGLIIVVFYFFMMRPQMKKAKEQRSFVDELDKGKKVVTIGGIVGKIVDTTDTTFVIECKGGTKIEVLRSAISLENSKALNNKAADKDDSKKSKKSETDVEEIAEKA